MTKSEFKIWLAHHSSAYPGLSKWLAVNKGVLPFWESCLADVSLEDAMAATTLLFSQQDQPVGYGKHPVSIRTLIYGMEAKRSQATKFTFSNETYDCDLCSDTGYVSVLAAETVVDILTNAERIRYRSNDVACICCAGQARKSSWNGKLPCYNPAAHLKLDTIVTERDLDYYREWIGKLTQDYVRTYQRIAGAGEIRFIEFDEWNSAT